MFIESKFAKSQFQPESSYMFNFMPNSDSGAKPWQTKILQPFFFIVEAHTIRFTHIHEWRMNRSVMFCFIPQRLHKATVFFDSFGSASYRWCQGSRERNHFPLTKPFCSTVCLMSCALLQANTTKRTWQREETNRRTKQTEPYIDILEILLPFNHRINLSFMAPPNKQ